MWRRDVGVLMDQGEHWLARDSERTAVETAGHGGGQRKAGRRATEVWRRGGRHPTTCRDFGLTSCPSPSLYGLPNCSEHRGLHFAYQRNE